MPEDARVHNVLAVAPAKIQDFQQAPAALETARRLEPNNTLFHSNLTCVEQHLQGCVLTA
jgi:Flp pilus assembly protein TadD